MIQHFMIQNADALKAAKMDRVSGPYYGGGTGGGGKVFASTNAWARSRGEHLRKNDFRFQAEIALSLFRGACENERHEYDCQLNADANNALADDFLVF